MAAALGISRTTYQKLERGTDDNPRLRYYVNAALALGVDPRELLEDEWFEWKVFDARRDRPPEPERFWRRHDDD